MAAFKQLRDNFRNDQNMALDDIVAKRIYKSFSSRFKALRCLNVSFHVKTDILSTGRRSNPLRISIL